MSKTTNKTDLSALLTTADLATRLGKSEGNIRVMRHRGQLPAAMKIGRGVFWPADRIAAYEAQLAAEKGPSQ
jgi:predicted DNA-binding transcriptional regulator AlpA